MRKTAYYLLKLCQILEGYPLPVKIYVTLALQAGVGLELETEQAEGVYITWPNGSYIK